MTKLILGGFLSGVGFVLASILVPAFIVFIAHGGVVHFLVLALVAHFIAGRIWRR